MLKNKKSFDMDKFLMTWFRGSWSAWCQTGPVWETSM